MEEAAKDLQDSSSDGFSVKRKELFIEDFSEKRNREITPIYNKPNMVFDKTDPRNKQSF